MTLCAQKLKDLGTEQPHRAIIDCIKAIAEALVQQEARLEHLQAKGARQNPAI